MMIKLWLAGQTAKQKAKNAMISFIKEEKGASDIVAIVLILVVVVALVTAFRTQIGKLFNAAWEKIFEKAEVGTFEESTFN